MSRICPDCNKSHDTILEGRNGERYEEFEKCYDCFMIDWFHRNPPVMQKEQVVINENTP